MEPERPNAKQPLPPEQVVAKAAILAECERLAETGITFVAVHFDGSGDEGANEDVKCYAAEEYVYEESELQESKFSHCRNILRRWFPTVTRMIVEASAT